MPLIALTCPACGAPVSPSSAPVLVCAYCAHSLVGDAGANWEAWARATPEELPASGGERACRVAGHKLFVRGLIGRGARSDVWLAERARRPSELVVLKVSRDEAARDSLAREWRLVSELGLRETELSPRMTTLLPQPVARGALTSGADAPRSALVYRWRSGYLHTLRDVRAAYPTGIDARTAVWIWRRLTELLGWIHDNGVRHGAVLPEHVLIHPRDHGVTLVGWSSARAVDESSPAPNLDLADSARTLLFALANTRVPWPVRALLDEVVAGEVSDGLALSNDIFRAATAAFGPPTYHPFTMPGWH